MTSFREMRIFLIVILFIINASDGLLSPEEQLHLARTRKLNSRVKMMGKSLENVLSLLVEMRGQKDQCESTVANMTEELKQLSDKIDNLGGLSSGAPHSQIGRITRQLCYFIDNLNSTQVVITYYKYFTHPVDLTDREDHIDGRPVTVDVTTSFDDCLNSLDMNIMTEENAYIWCLRTALWQYNSYDESEQFENDEELEILQITDSARQKRSSRFIRRWLAPSDMTQPPSGFRTRKEYRTLSLQERQIFHDALNVLYEDGTIDCFARVHRNAIRRNGAHRGVAFLPWHRAFLAFFEEALRQVNSSVILPYWDSSKDDNMEVGPGLSVMWDDAHFGQGHGIVGSGPFAGWITADSPLRRDIARGVGSLIRQSRIDSAMQFCRLGDFHSRWENVHNGVHRWIGGTMARSLAASDPVFYMHHAFIDYQWEKFRKRQEVDCGIDPSFDYPPTSDENHAPESTMDGMSFLMNKDGIADYWTTNWYTYEDSPSCATSCGNTPDLFCDPAKNLCVSEMRVDLNAGERMMEQAPTAMAMQVSSNVDCRKNLYAKSCPGPPEPKTQLEYVERMVRKEIEMPPEIEAVEHMIKKEVARTEEFPPDSEPIFFQAAPDEPNDCRTSETCVFDLITAIIRGKKVTKRRYAGFEKLNV